MKFLTVSAVTLSVLGFASAAQAQQQGGRLFFEGDVIRGNQPGAPGPACVLNNQFKRLEKVVFRFRILDQNGNALDASGIKSLFVDVPGGNTKLQAAYGPHPGGNNTPIVAVLPGGLGDALQQMFGYNFSGYAVGFNLQIPLSKRAIGADHDRALSAQRTSKAQAEATAQKIALELFHRAIEDGVRFRWITADEFYGRSREFREAISAVAGVNYVVEIPNSLTGWTKRSVVGRKRPARPVSKLWERSGPPWVLYRIKDTDKGPELWKIRETRFYPHSGARDRALRLIIATNVLSGETKYFLSDARPGVPLKTLLHVAFSRWHIERLFEDAKGEVGLDHFEVRNYRSLMRHLVISNVSLYFLSEQTKLLREKKPLVDPLPGQGCNRGSTGPGDVSEGTDSSSQQGRGHHRVPPTPSGVCGSLPPQTQAA
jgi:hypothetical protein